MKATWLVLLAMAASGFTSETYRLEPASGNRIAIEVDKTGLLRGKKHTFIFGRYTGAVEYNADNPEASKVNFEIQAKSIICLDTWVSDKDRVKVMKAAIDDVLEADRYPTISFVSSQIRSNGANKFDVTGTLSLRGIIQPVTVAVTRTGNTYDGSAVVNMKDFGIKPPSTAFGAVGTKELMIVTFHLAAVS